MNEVEKYKKELIEVLHCGDRYGDGCNGDYDCEECLEATRRAFTNFENLVRADERRRVEEDFQNSDYWNDYLAKVLADERAKVLDKIIDIVAIACKFDEDNKTEMKQYILEQLKEQKNERAYMRKV